MQEFAYWAVSKFSVAYWREPLISRHLDVELLGILQTLYFHFHLSKKRWGLLFFLWDDLPFSAWKLGPQDYWILGVIHFGQDSKGQLLVRHLISQSTFMTLKSLCYLAATSTDNFFCSDLWLFICVDKLLDVLTTEQIRLKCVTDDFD